jgi:hypothetical protein
MRYRLRTLLIVLALGPLAWAIWSTTESVSEAVWWTVAIAFFGLCYWTIRRAQETTKGSYKYAEGDSGGGAEGGV